MRRALLERLRTWILGPRRWRPASREGQQAERLAARYLARRGFRVIARNVRTSAGEADLLCTAPDRRTMVVVEVKYRAAGAGHERALVAPEAAVDAEKRRRLRRVARRLAAANGWTDRPWRLDVIAIERSAGKQKPEIRHAEGVPW